MGKFRVLLVDDEEEFARALAERLEIRGLDVDLAFSGEEALVELESISPQVIVLDLKMPGIDGMEVLRQVRRRWKAVQVIMLTGHGSQLDREAALGYGAFQYLQKPVDIKELLTVLERAVQEAGTEV